MSYAEFIKELAKNKIKLPLLQVAEWEEFFPQEATKVLLLNKEIDTTEKTIDTMVFELNGFSEHEIKILEVA